MKKINESFKCIYCNKTISQAPKTCRNHCPFCFVSLHVDDKIPGDRKSECGSKMYPIMYKISNGGMKILFECEVCLHKHRNKKAEDDEVIKLDSLIQEYKSKF